MKSSAVLFVACVSAAAFCNAFAQNVHTVEISGQPLTYMRDGNPHGCGVRLIGGLFPTTPSDIEMFDVSVNVYRDSGALVKVVSYNTTVAELKGGKPPRRAHVSQGWIRAPGSTATSSPDGSFSKGDDGFSILYRTSMDSALAVYRAIDKAVTLNVGIRRAGQPTEKIFAGRVKLSEDERDQFASCITELTR